MRSRVSRNGVHPAASFFWMSTGLRGAERRRRPHLPRDSGVHRPRPRQPGVHEMLRGRLHPRACPWQHLELLREPLVNRREPAPRDRGTAMCLRGVGLGQLGTTALWPSGSLLSPHRAMPGRSTVHGRAVCRVSSARREVKAGWPTRHPSPAGLSLQQMAANATHRGPLGPSWDSRSQLDVQDEAGPCGWKMAPHVGNTPAHAPPRGGLSTQCGVTVATSSPPPGPAGRKTCPCGRRFGLRHRPSWPCLLMKFNAPGHGLDTHRGF